MEVIPFTDISVWVIAKYIVVFGLLLYLVFAVVMVRQVQLMIKTIESGFEWGIKLLAYFHLLFAIAVLLFAIIIL